MSAITTSVGGLFVCRGTSKGAMTTLGLQWEVTNREKYLFDGEGLSFSSGLAIDLEGREPLKVEKPPFLEIEAVWDKRPLASGHGNNILGDNGELLLPVDSMEVPVIEATNATLAYYGATLLERGDIVAFPDASFPIFRMTVGEDYVRDFVMSDEGDGLYLEYHTDKPHFHLPLKGGGCYLLGRFEGSKLQLTGFRIPDGKAVYTKKGVIHCDAALSGDLLVGYDKAEDCSTVLLRSPAKTRVEVRFI